MNEEKNNEPKTSAKRSHYGTLDVSNSNVGAGIAGQEPEKYLFWKVSTFCKNIPHAIESVAQRIGTVFSPERGKSSYSPISTGTSRQKK